MERYFTYAKYLQKKYGVKTYKLPVAIPVSCPNRDGTKGTTGCHFCSEKGTGFEHIGDKTSITNQLLDVKTKMTKRYKAKKFIAYFQNYTNTYQPVETLIKYMEECLIEDVVGIDIATRPDCIDATYIKELSKFSQLHKIDITIELGLQIANDEILESIQRGHTVSEYIMAAQIIKEHGLYLTTHIIGNLPKTTKEDIIRTATLMNTVSSDIVKLHSLYIAKGTMFAKWYEKNPSIVGTEEEYVERVCLFLKNLDKQIAVSRIVSRIPEQDALFANWGKHWFAIYNRILEKMIEENIEQGMDV